MSYISPENEGNLLLLTSVLLSVLWPLCLCTLERFKVELSTHRVHIHSRWCSSCNKYCVPFTATYDALLSGYLKLQVMRAHFFYLGPPVSICTEIVDISSKQPQFDGLNHPTPRA